MNQTCVASCTPSKGRSVAGVGRSAVGCLTLGNAIQKSHWLPAESQTFKMCLSLVCPLQFLEKKLEVQRWSVKSLSPHCSGETASGSPGPRPEHSL